ncbi:hypothetical protein HZF24_13740 [Sedimentibacter hydroxybenzoicus DSM 7310]|uniref:Uncharacterized protein n=1 Tax=Sedimentibacter hydroxybenzoicus DSM 7310 TaxID=1123245 RepID=A0A974BLT7_SEDHY|nr:DUF5693 family protein [Sedimentibacter hydroxybenzoicus]NYB75206.1 hypothetical protein [Sedimentibacter hydroxybenzoicus DSM 7310]
MKLKIDKIVLVLISLSLLVGIYTVYQRVEIEKQYKTAEIILDYSEMKKFADSSEEDLDWWLREFKKYGAESVAVPEETVKLLIESGKPLRAEIVSEMIKNYNWQNDYNEQISVMVDEGVIKNNDVLITTRDESLFDYLNSGLTERYDNEFFDTYHMNDDYYIVLKGTNDDIYYSDIQKVWDLEGKGVYESKIVADSRLLNIGIGYDEEKINLIKDSGLDVILRPINFPTYNEKLTDVYISANEKYDLKPRIYLLGSKEVLGYPENEQSLLDYVKENNIAIALIENSTQREHLDGKGLNKLVEKSGYSAMRVFTMWDYIRERNKYYNYEGAEEIENTMFRAITERNIRAIYFKPFFEEQKSAKYLTDAEEYERTFSSLESRLSEHNIKLGKAESMKEFHVGSKRLSVLAFGITLAAVLLFIKMFNIKDSRASYLYLFAVPAAFIPLVARGIAEKGFAFAAAVIFSGLGIYFYIIQIKKIYVDTKKYSFINIISYSTLILTGAVIISLAGAIFLDAMLADVKYFLEMDIFRGVKFAQILPFGIFLVMFIIYFMNKEEDESVKSVVKTTARFLNKEVKIYYGIIVGIIGAAAYIYISRTGHETNVQPSSIEMISRNFMEYVLLARPRTKEFLIAFPAIFAAVYAAGKKSEFFTGIFMLAAAMGTSSIVNTFSHLRTPIYLSLARTVIALGFGIVVGVIAVIIMDVLHKIYLRLQERFK